jgi:CRP-like cAMP-binding protein
MARVTAVSFLAAAVDLPEHAATPRTVVRHLFPQRVHLGLMLARYGKPEQTHRVLPRISQETLAEMIGTTRSRVSFFMNKFRRLGLIDYRDRIEVRRSLLDFILREQPEIKI